MLEPNCYELLQPKSFGMQRQASVMMAARSHWVSSPTLLAFLGSATTTGGSRRDALAGDRKRRPPSKVSQASPSGRVGHFVKISQSG